MGFSYLEMCEEIMPESPGAAYNRVRLINGYLRYFLSNLYDWIRSCKD